MRLVVVLVIYFGGEFVVGIIHARLSYHPIFVSFFRSYRLVGSWCIESYSQDALTRNWESVASGIRGCNRAKVEVNCKLWVSWRLSCTGKTS